MHLKSIRPKEDVNGKSADLRSVSYLAMDFPSTVSVLVHSGWMLLVVVVVVLERIDGMVEN